MIHLVFKKCFNLYDKRLRGIVHFKPFDHILMYVDTFNNILQGKQKI